MKDFDGLYNIRPYTKEDANFILATWLRGLYYGNSAFSDMPKDLFMYRYKSVVNTALVSPNVKILVACLKEDPNTILGYSIVSADGRAVVWVFVKSAWRKQGIGRALLPTEPIFATHLTELGKTLLYKLGALFDPFY
jgi:GNAT superfamily N-acetyltransferase